MKNSFFTSILPRLITFFALLTASQFYCQSPNTDKALELAKKALVYMNEFRAQNNMPPLQWNQDIADQARAHSQKMSSIKVLSHDGFQERANQLRVTHPRLSGIAENVAQTYEQPDIAQSVITMWQNSPGHRANMLGKYQYAAISFAPSNDGNWYATAIFANF